MKASHFPREYIGFELETQKFLTSDELVARGVTLAGDGLPHFSSQPFEFVILWWSGQKDSENHKLFEGDLCEMDVINEFGSRTREKSIMQWHEKKSQFVLMMGSRTPNIYMTVEKVKKIGHEFTDPLIAEEIKNKGMIKNG